MISLKRCSQERKASNRAKIVKGSIPKKRKSIFYNTLPSIFLPKIRKTNKSILHKVHKTPFLSSFWLKFAENPYFTTKKNFREKLFRPFFTTHCPQSLCQKSEKTMNQFCTKSKNPNLGSFWPKFVPEFFLKNRASSNFGYCYLT